MIMAKNPFSFMKSQTFGGRSPSSWLTSHSSIIEHNSSTGPSRKACSSAVSFGAAASVSFCQRGAPENSSPSHQTEPASRASRSVDDMEGSMRRYMDSRGRVILDRRNSGTLSATMPANSSHSNSAHRVAGSPMSVYAASARNVAIVEAVRPARR
jgi:hypothetical protein